MKGSVRKIVVAMDNSEYSITAAHWGAHLAAHAEAELVIVHVIDARYTEGPWFADVAAALGAAPYENLVHTLRQAMTERGTNIVAVGEKIARDHGVEVRTHLRDGLFVDIIKEETHDANLLILGRRGDDYSRGSHLLGTAGERAIRQVGCTCLVVPSTFVEPERMVVGVNDSGPSRSACAWASYLHEVFPALRVQPLHVRRAGDATNFAAERVCGVPVEVRDGAPETVIAAECAVDAERSLCVIGATGHSRSLLELILGTLTFHILHQVNSPVLIAR